jgi:polysaccharide biosynthesis protein PslG
MRPCLRGVLTVAVAALAIASPAAAANAPFGFNDHSVGQGQATPALSAQLAKSAGATLSRTSFSWRDAEPSPGKLALSFYDQIYNADLAQGIRPIFTIMNAPRWALPSGVTCAAGEDCRYPPAPEHDGAWRAIIATIANRYPNLAALEIWNEPNVTHYWNGTMDPVRYTDLVKQAYASAKAVNPTLPVIAGGLANLMTDTSVGKAYRPFLRAMYGAGIKGSMDGLSIHPYPSDIDPWMTYRMLGDVRDLRDNAGDTQTKLWITEIGASTNDTTNPDFDFDFNSQAVTLVRLQARLRAMPDVAATLVHTLINDTSAPAGSTARGYGVIGPEPTLIPKPAYCALANANQTGYVCPAGVVNELLTPGIQVLRWRAQELLQTAADAARAYRARNGSYTGLTRTALHALAPEISETAPNQKLMPGATADPSRVSVSVWKALTGQQFLMLCNTSQADRSYCIKTAPTATWVYGSTTDTINATADAIVHGRTFSW